MSVYANKLSLNSAGGWVVRALVIRYDSRMFESNQWFSSFYFQILSYLLGVISEFIHCIQLSDFTLQNPLTSDRALVHTQVNFLVMN